MMASMTMHRVGSRLPSSSSACPRVPSVRRPCTVVFAQDPKFTLDSSSKAAEGYVEKDTAGQSNMYPTVIKPFEAGSSADTVNQDNFNDNLLVAGTFLALGAIGLGLGAIMTGGKADMSAAPAEDFSSYASLSEYAASFSAELAPPAPAPVLAAPEVAVEAAAAAAVVEVVAEVSEAVAEAAAPVVEAVAEAVAEVSSA